MDKEFLLNEFQKEFREPRVKTHDMLMELININKQVRTWYKDLKQKQSTLVEMPDSFKNAGVTVEEWDALEDQRNILRNANKNYAKKANEAARQFQKAMKQADLERLAELNKVEMLVKLTAITVNELPQQTQISLLMIEGGDERKKETKARIDSYVTSLINELRQNNTLSANPFA